MKHVNDAERRATTYMAMREPYTLRGEMRAAWPAFVGAMLGICVLIPWCAGVLHLGRLLLALLYG